MSGTNGYCMVIVLWGGHRWTQALVLNCRTRRRIDLAKVRHDDLLWHLVPLPCGRSRMGAVALQPSSCWAHFSSVVAFYDNRLTFLDAFAYQLAVITPAMFSAS